MEGLSAVRPIAVAGGSQFIAAEEDEAASSIDRFESETWHFCHKERKNANSLRTLCPLRPTLFDAEAMTSSEMMVLEMDEILLRTEISGTSEEGDSARGVRTGLARARPRQARPSRMTARDFTSERLRPRRHA